VTTARERILIVEDDSAARIGLQQLVRGWGFDVETAADGEQALGQIEAFHPAIVVKHPDGLGCDCTLIRAFIWYCLGSIRWRPSFP